MWVLYLISIYPVTSWSITGYNIAGLLRAIFSVYFLCIQLHYYYEDAVASHSSVLCSLWGNLKDAVLNAAL